MHPIKPAFIDMVVRATDWCDSAPDGFIAVTNDSGGTERYLYTRAECDAIDTRLSFALARVVNTHYWSSREKALAVRTTLQHWVQPGIPIAGRGSNEDAGYVCSVEDARAWYGFAVDVMQIDMANEPGWLRLHVLSYRLVPLSGSIAVAGPCAVRIVEVPQDWLEHTYPGSLRRVEIARTLALRPDEVADYAIRYQEEGAALQLPVDLSSVD